VWPTGTRRGQPTPGGLARLRSRRADARLPLHRAAPAAFVAPAELARALRTGSRAENPLPASAGLFGVDRATPPAPSTGR